MLGQLCELAARARSTPTRTHVALFVLHLARVNKFLLWIPSLARALQNACFDADPEAITACSAALATCYPHLLALALRNPMTSELFNIQATGPSNGNIPCKFIPPLPPGISSGAQAAWDARRQLLSFLTAPRCSPDARKAVMRFACSLVLAHTEPTRAEWFRARAAQAGTRD